MSENLWVSETFLNKTKDFRFGDTEPYETYTDTIGQLFREMQREYGRCVSRVYTDASGTTKQIGWVFEKRMQYEDARGNDTERDYYIREVWVTVYTAPPTKSIKYHYYDFGGSNA
jgi:hypothetical protein